MFETVSIDEPRDDIHRLRLERRRKLNAFNEQLLHELELAVDQLRERKPEAVVLEGAGSRAFSIGLDTRAPIAQKDDSAAGEAISRQGQESMEGVASLSVPVVAGIQGYALGGGLELALTADFRVGGESSTYGLPEVTKGLIPGAGATQRLPSVVGQGRAYEMLFTGEKYDAETMANWGLLAAVVEDDAVTEATLDMAEHLAETGHPPDPDEDGAFAGYLLEQSGLSRAFSADPFDVAAEEG